MQTLARVIWLLWGLCGWGMCIRSQAKDINFEHLSVEKGLSSTSVYALSQTPDGFLWAGSQFGLNRYNGYGFRIFSFSPNDASSLSNNWVKALLSDRSGTLWVGTSDGLNRYQPERESFVHYRAGPDPATSLVDDNIWCLFEDSKGVLWVGTNEGLGRYDPARDLFTSFQVPASKQGTPIAINAITEDRQGRLWVGTWGGGVFQFDRAQKKFRPLRDLLPDFELGDAFVKVLKTDRQGHLWVGTQKDGLHQIDLLGRKHRAFRNNPQDARTLSDNYILSMLEDRQGRIWVGTYTSGLNLYEPATSTFIRYQQDLLLPESIHGSWITSLFQDSNGFLWAGHDNGLSKFDPGGPRFKLFRNNPYNPNSIPKSNINAIYEDREGLLWIGMWGMGLSIYDPRTRLFRHFRQEPGKPGSLINNQVWGFCEDDQGRLWVATSSGLVSFDRQTSTFVSFQDGPGQVPTASITHPNASSLAKDRLGRLWIGTFGNGVYVYDPATATSRHFPADPDDPSMLSNGRVKHLMVSSDNTVWIATSEGGLNKLNLDPQGRARFHRFVYDAHSPMSLGSNSPLVTFEDRNGRIWVGAEGSGLSLYDPKHNGFRRIQLQGVSAKLNTVFGILQDQKDNLWLSTNHGIVSYNPATGNTRVFDVSDGLQGNAFLGGQCRTRAGLMLFGGHNGFNQFDPQEIRESRFVPPVLITELRLFNELVETGQPHRGALAGEPPVLSKPLYLTPEIRLSYKDYVLSFGFATLDFASPGKNRYAYMLQNFEDLWNFTDASMRTATYTNLEPGAYIFKVRGSNSDGIWNGQVTSLRVVVTPPFWLTLWFRLLVFGVVVLLVYLTVRIRLQVRLDRLLAVERIKATETEHVRKRVAMDFHDEMGNQLASITALINLINIRFGKQDYQIDDLLKKLNQHAQSLFYGTKDFIWSIDPKSDHADVILMNIRDFGEDLFGGTGISFSFNTSRALDHVVLPAGYSRHVTLICKEVFTNIVKHARCEHVRVQAETSPSHLEICITDDGCGFDPNNTSKPGFGLENIRARASKIGGQVRIFNGRENTLGVGTEIVLTVPIPQMGEKKRKNRLGLKQELI